MKKRNKIIQLSIALSMGLMSANAQNVANFDDLTLESESFYDGSSDHSGTPYATENFQYRSCDVNFSLSYSDWGGSGSFSGMAYSNQTDLTNASFENFSAYANPAGAYSGNNFGIFFPSWSGGDSIFFDDPVNLISTYITNHVWTYHYIMGTDGVGNGTFETGDSLAITISGYNQDSEHVGDVIFYLADFTGNNSMVVENWTEVDLSTLSNVSYLKFKISSTDSWAPTYLCLDDLSYTNLSGIEKEKNMSSISIYPNPSSDFITIENEIGNTYQIIDIQGRTINQGIIENKIEKISIQDLYSGIYYIVINNQVEKLIKY
jgi:hypothetical protein